MKKFFLGSLGLGIILMIVSFTQDTDVDRLLVDGVPAIDSRGNGGVLNIGGLSANPTFSEVAFYTQDTKRVTINSSGMNVTGDIHARNVGTHDLTFQKGDTVLWTMYEDENGLYLKSELTGKKYKIVLKEINSK